MKKINKKRLDNFRNATVRMWLVNFLGGENGKAFQV